MHWFHTTNIAEKIPFFHCPLDIFCIWDIVGSTAGIHLFPVWWISSKSVNQKHCLLKQTRSEFVINICVCVCRHHHHGNHSFICCGPGHRIFTRIKMMCNLLSFRFVFVFVLMFNCSIYLTLNRWLFFTLYRLLYCHSLDAAVAMSLSLFFHTNEINKKESSTWCPLPLSNSAPC